MYKLFRCLCVLAFVWAATFFNGYAQPYQVNIITTVRQPVRLFINQTITTNGSGVNAFLSNTSAVTSGIRLVGSVRQLSPSNFTIKLKDSYRPQKAISLLPGASTRVTDEMLSDAFGNFKETDLEFQGVSTNTLKEGLNYKLPEGTYSFCLEARDFATDRPASAPGSGCVTFNICNQAAAPQFTQPVNNFTFSTTLNVVKPMPKLIFTWTPPAATCQLVNNPFFYEFEIRELLDNQTINDVVNNPFIFRKNRLPSTTFLFDADLYKDILKPGNRYAIRVRAINAMANSPVVVDNAGYSRIEIFQYGESNLNTNPATVYEPANYYASFSERRSSYWDDVYDAFTKGMRKDTLVPIKEYIGLRLMQQGYAYSFDAIDIFLALNPELVNVKFVKISHRPRYPQLPEISSSKLSAFSTEYGEDLSPDPVEEATFRKLADSLLLANVSKQYADSTGARLRELVQALSLFKTEVHGVNRVSTNLINSLLTELLYIIREDATARQPRQILHLHEVITDLQELIVSSKIALSHRWHMEHYRYRQVAGASAPRFNFAAYNPAPINTPQKQVFAAGDALLPFQVMVFRKKAPPAEPQLNAPDLTATFRIFYTPKGLYNYKNPEINTKTLNQLASTTQVSLPLTSTYKFWSLNMLDHKLTKPNDVDVKDLFVNSKKKGADKNLKILIRVD